MIRGDEKIIWEFVCSPNVDFFIKPVKRVFNVILSFSQLYKLSGGNQVDPLPPAASFDDLGRRNLRL